MQELLAGQVSELDDGILVAFGSLLPEGDYLPLLLRVEPRLVIPGQDGDYFSNEQVATWGPDQFWGLPEHPRTPYYRTFETVIDDTAHLYEFAVPMVPPLWNNRERVAEYVEWMGQGVVPTAVAVSTLDLCQPALSLQSTDEYEHWGLTHFLLDGHHSWRRQPRPDVPCSSCRSWPWTRACPAPMTTAGWEPCAHRAA